MSAEFFNIIPHEVPCQHIRKYPGATKDGRDVELKLAVKEYVPRKPIKDEGVTIIAAGGNGFPKEMYEPLWDDILNSPRMKGVTIRSIWTADMANQGRSGELNEGRIGTDYSWMDHSRDLLVLVNHFRESIKPPIVGIGHSIGANALISLSVLHSRLFSDLILYEPILGYVANDGSRRDCTAEGVHFAFLASKQASIWPSRQVAEDAISNAKPFVDFDARVLRRWFAQGLRSSTVGEEAVELVTSKLQEATTYVRPLFDPQVENNPGTAGNQLDKTTYPDYDDSVSGLRSFYCPESWRTFARLRELQSRALFVFGERSAMCPEQKRRSIMAVAGTGSFGHGGKELGRVSEAVVPELGHLMIFENVAKCAQVAAGHLSSVCEAGQRPTVLSAMDKETGRPTVTWTREIKLEATRARELKTAAKI